MLKDTRFTYHFCILLLPFAIVHFLVRFCKKWWFLLLQPSCWLRHAFFSSHSCFVLRNAWHKPVKTIDYCNLSVLWSSLHINCAYPFFIFLPIYGCITLRLGTQSKSHVCLKIHRPLPVTSCLLICTNLSGTTQTWEMHTWHLICLHVQCPLNISTIVV